ncbi:MAG: cytochrome c [Gemmatimonadota bacterium]|nr:cytochrome c [Gemmatimonadota bacterium]
MRGRRGVPALVAGLAALALTGCDDQVKRVPWFKTMFRTEQVETYEVEHPLPPEGTVAVGTRRPLDLLAADTLLASPLGEVTPEILERGETAYRRYCIVCHGETGAGDGPVVGPNRLPPLPTLNLLSDRATLELSDGYIWGMIENGRGVMPAYRRVPDEDRWALVAWVRELQARGRAGTQAGAGGAAADGSGS